MPIFRVKSAKIYTGQKKFTRAPLVVLVTNIRYVYNFNVNPPQSCPKEIVQFQVFPLTMEPLLLQGWLRWAHNCHHDHSPRLSWSWSIIVITATITKTTTNLRIIIGIHWLVQTSSSPTLLLWMTRLYCSPQRHHHHNHNRNHNHNPKGSKLSPPTSLWPGCTALPGMSSPTQALCQGLVPG